MGFGAAQQTTTTGAVFIATKLSRDLEKARESKKVMAGLVNRRDFDVADDGGTISVPFVSNLSATAVSDNTSVTFQAPTEVAISISINRHFESSVAIQDRLSAQAKYDLMQAYKGKVNEALDRQVETDLTGLYSGLSQTVGTGNAALTEANVVRAIQYLNDANAPQEDRHFVVKPGAMNHLQQIGRFTEYQSVNNGKAPMVGGNNGLVGDVFGVAVHMTTNIAQVSGTPGTIHNLLFHQDAFCLAMQRNVKVEMMRRPDFLATGVIASVLYGYVELRDDHGIDVRTVINT